MIVFFFKQKTAYEMRIRDWSSDVCSSDLEPVLGGVVRREPHPRAVLVHASDGDESPAASGGDHALRGALDAEKGAVQIDGERPAPDFDSQLQERGAVDHAGVAHVHVDAAEALGERVHGGRARRGVPDIQVRDLRAEEHTSELQSLMRTANAVFCLKK